MRPILAQFPRNSAIVAKRNRASSGEQRGESKFQPAKHRAGEYWGARPDSPRLRLRRWLPVSINLGMRHAEKTDCDFLKFTHGAHPFHGISKFNDHRLLP